MTVTVINEDIMAQRINIKLKKRLAKRREKDELLVYCKESGPVNKILLIKIFKFFQIPSGLARKIYIRIQTNDDIIGEYKRAFWVISKNQKYKIPINATIVNDEEYNKTNDNFNKKTNVLEIIKKNKVFLIFL